MLEIKISVSCPDLVLAATALAKCLRPNNAADTPALPAVQASPVAPTVPAAPATPPVPLAPVPQYSMDQIARAGADLVTREPAKAAAAQQLLASFGVQTVSELPKERFGEFVTALRGLGASI